MQMDAAPYFDDVADGPQGAASYWIHASDGVRLRICHWPLDGAAGTVLLFPGRTEYVEKYASSAAELGARGFAVIAIDWRGQGLADRLLPEPRIGHVQRFTDYQRDVAAMIDAARSLAAPGPWHLLGHSMGGAIGLRAAMDGLDVASAAFTGPMWGIRLPVIMRPLAWAIINAGRIGGFSDRLPPQTRMETYVLAEPFKNNTLTGDPEMFAMMQAQVRAHPELALGGPSIHWMDQALSELRALDQRASPAMPGLTFCGTCEAIVSQSKIRDRMARWPNGTLEFLDGGRHELLIETPAMRNRVLDRIAAHFHAAAPS